MNRCSICRGRIKDNKICCRCGADLSLLFKIETKHDSLCYQSIKALYNKKHESAYQYASQAFQLKRSSLSEFLYLYLNKVEEHVLDNDTYF